MSRIGFRFHENMAGTFRRSGEPEDARHRFMFHVDAVSHDALRTLRDGRVEATGYVEAEGLAAHAPLEGFVIMRPLVTRIVRYEFEFTGDDGCRYRYAGQKDIRHLHPVRTWTTLPGTIRDADGNEAATSVAYFDLKELGPFLLSYRPFLSRGAADAGASGTGTAARAAAPR